MAIPKTDDRVPLETRCTNSSLHFNRGNPHRGAERQSYLLNQWYVLKTHQTGRWWMHQRTQSSATNRRDEVAFPRRPLSPGAAAPARDNSAVALEPRAGGGARQTWRVRGSPWPRSAPLVMKGKGKGTRRDLEKAYLDRPGLPQGWHNPSESESPSAPASAKQITARMLEKL